MYKCKIFLKLKVERINQRQFYQKVHIDFKAVQNVNVQ